MLPTTFGNPLWFSDEELLELKGTALYRAIELQVMYLFSALSPMSCLKLSFFLLLYNRKAEVSE